MSLKMLHVCIRVKDLDASIKFYRDALGLVETKRKDHTEDGFILVYLSDEAGDYELELTYNIGSKGYDLGNGYSHIAIGVDDLEAEHKKHEEMGYEVTKPKSISGGKPNLYFVTDPDGYKVEVIRNK